MQNVLFGRTFHMETQSEDLEVSKGNYTYFLLVEVFVIKYEKIYTISSNVIV